MTSGFRKVPAKYKACPTGKGLSALTNFEINSQFRKSSVKSRIIIKCSDTDVLVLCVHYYPRMQNTDQLWLLMGSVTSIKDGIHLVEYEQGSNLCW
jgi:hypothetical protein